MDQPNLLKWIGLYMNDNSNDNIIKILSDVSRKIINNTNNLNNGILAEEDKLFLHEIVKLALYNYERGVPTGLTDLEYDEICSILELNGVEETLSSNVLLTGINYVSHPATKYRGSIRKNKDLSTKSIQCLVGDSGTLGIVPKFNGVSVQGIINNNDVFDIKQFVLRGHLQTNMTIDVTDKMKNIPFEYIQDLYYFKDLEYVQFELMVTNTILKEKYPKYETSLELVSAYLNRLDDDIDPLDLSLIPLRIGNNTEYKYLVEPLNFYEITDEIGDELNEAKNNWEFIYNDFELDGIVIKLYQDNYTEFNSETGYYKGELAWKFQYNTKAIKSKVVGVEFSLGMYNITPVILIEPIIMYNKTVRRINMYNINTLIDNNVAIGDEIKVNFNTIPYGYIDDECIRSGNKPIDVPEHCPCCNAPLDNYRCINEYCSYTVTKSIIHSLNAYGFKNIKFKNIKTIVEKYNIKDILDFYIDDKIDSNNIDKYKLTSITIPKLFELLNINSIGYMNSLKIHQSMIENNISINDIINDTNNSVSKLYSLNDNVISNLIKYIDSRRDKISMFLSNIDIIEPKTMPIVANVYFTSFRDNMLMNVALSKGYNVEKSFNKRVNILVYKDSMENNKKVEKALSKNIKVMSRDEFLELLK